MGNITQSAPVTGYYIGVWQRDLLETSTCKDDRSQVFWMQTPLYHIDLRIPASRINLSQVQSLQNYT